MAFLLQLKVVYSIILLLNMSSSAELESRARKTSDALKHRIRRDISEGAQIGSSENCQGCARSAPSYTPYCSGQCSMCPVGNPGPRGSPGQQGIPGRDGRDGRDAPLRDPDDKKEDEQEITPATASTGGAIYVRWGRDVCPDNSSLVYSGVAGGAYYQHTGSGSNYLCLPEEPLYDNPVAGTSGQERGYIYGSEYQTNTFSRWDALFQHDVPCAVCLAPSRHSLLMIPARNVCPDGGWVKEYSGYLVSERHTHQRTEFVCMDRDPEAYPGSVHNANGVLFYVVEGRCGESGSGLPCGPYVDGYELTCAVCTM